MSDLLVIGSGGAGLTAVLTAAQSGKRVTVVTKTLPTAAQTAMAQGGMNAAIHTPDTPDRHAADTLTAARGLADPEQVATLCRRAPEAVAWLESIGMPFSRTPEGGVARRTLGGASHPRACYAQDYTAPPVSRRATPIQRSRSRVSGYLILGMGLGFEGAACSLSAPMIFPRFPDRYGCRHTTGRRLWRHRLSQNC